MSGITAIEAFVSGGGGLATIAFIGQFGAGMLMLWLHPRLPVRIRAGDTHEVVKLATSMIVVMASVVLGLLASSLSSNFQGVEGDLRKFATELILTDRALREYGPDAAHARALLLGYAEQALHGTWPANGGAGVVADPSAALLLDDTERAILSLRPADTAQRALSTQAEARLTSVVNQRWTLIGEAQGTVSAPLMVVVILWMTLAFASLGYNAPRNRVVIATMLLAAASMSAAIFIIMELNGPFDGLLKVSPRPVQEAVATLQGPGAGP